MKRTDAEIEVVDALMSDMSYQELVRDMLDHEVETWTNDELADFLWGDDDSQTIEED